MVVRDDDRTELNEHPTLADDGHGPTRAAGPSSEGRRLPQTEPLFRQDQLVAGRYRIVRFIARGGMAEVYEAHDDDLGETVALKVILPEVAAGPKMLERFKREILLARKVTHPNVCRIFDVGYHADPERGHLTFLTMQLLRGSSLSEHLRAHGPLPTGETLQIAHKILAGLGAAHAVGVVHRDLKPQNVLLIDSEHGPEPVITDFGLARAHSSEESSGISGTGGTILGTPAYMAPEQLQRGAITPATDVYACGLLLYEMLTGRRPFSGGTPYELAFRRLEEPPTPLSSHEITVDDALERTVLRCLALDPSRRFADATELAAALAPSSSVAVSTRAWAPWTITAGAALLGLLVVLAVMLWRGPSPPPAGTAARPAVAVLGFRNVSGADGAAWMSTALAETLTTELAAGGQLRTVPGETVARLRFELGLESAGTLAADTLRAIHRNVGADYVLTGSYISLPQPSGDTLRLDVRAQNARTGETVAVTAANGPQSTLFDLVHQVTSELRRQLGIAGLDASATEQWRASLPTGSEAARHLAEGLEHLRTFELTAARDDFQAAVAADPDLARGWEELARTWSSLGYAVRAQEALQRAVGLSEGLPRATRLRLDARLAEARNDWDTAVATWSTLWQFFPDELAYGLPLIDAQLKAGTSAAAEATLTALRGLPEPTGTDPRLDLEEIAIAAAVGDAQRMVTAARRAVDAGDRSGARMLAARARLALAAAQVRLGEQEPVGRLCDAAQTVFAEAGDRAGEGQLQLVRGAAAYHRGDLDAAEAHWTTARATFRELGARADELKALGNLAGVAFHRGQLDTAEATFREILDVAREVIDRSTEARTLNNLAVIHQRRAELSQARELLEGSLQIRRSMGDRSGTAATLGNLGGVQIALGDLDAAEATFAEAHTLATELGNRRLQAEALSGQGDVAYWRDRLELAADRFESARALYEAMGQVPAAEEASRELASVALARGDADTANAAYRELAKAASERGDTAAELSSRTGLIRGLVAARDIPGAREAAARARQLAGPEGSDVLVRTAIARVDSAEGNHAEALSALRNAVESARSRSILGLELEAEVALGAAEITAGREATGRQRLERTAARAEAAGFALIARHAREALAGE